MGYAANARLIGLHAELHKQTAWFCVHSGLAASALKEAEKAIELAAVARFEAGARRSSNGYMQQAIDASLIASQALLIAHQPEAALRYLDLACHASEGIRIPIGSDQFRQRGDAYFQLKNDGDARKFYRHAAETMQRLGEARNEAHLLMYGPRQSNLLDPVDWDRAQEILGAVADTFGAESHEHTTTVHWTAACGLMTDSPSTNSRALELLEENRARAARGGHQATISRLLALTPDLKFYPRLRATWVRRAMFENAFRRK